LISHHSNGYENDRRGRRSTIGRPACAARHQCPRKDVTEMEKDCTGVFIGVLLGEILGVLLGVLLGVFQGC